MKQRYRFSLLILLLISSLLVSSCEPKKAPSTLEEFVSAEEVAAELQEDADSPGNTISISGNDIVYSYDMSKIKNFKEDVLESEQFIESLTADLESQAGIYSNTCRSLEEKTGLTGITLTVEYKNGDDVIISQTFTS